MAEMKIDSLTKTYPSGVKALENLNLNVKEGESLALFGLERSGKSTLLRVLAGLENATSGRILLNGKDVTDLPSKERNVSYVFQNTTLDNRESVYENLAYGLKLRKAPAAVIDVKVKAVAQLLGLSDVLARKPKTLSASVRRRVVFGRTVVRDPGVYLFDEPLSGLDEDLRAQILKDLVKLQIRLGATFIYATDDIREAISIGSKVAILSEGRLLQCDAPEKLYAAPVDGFVAEIMGSASETAQEA